MYKSHIRYLMGAALGVESEAVAEPVSPVVVNINNGGQTEQLAVSPTDTPAEAVVQAAAAEAPIAAAETADDELNGVLEGLESLKTTLTESLKNGGISPMAAMYMQGWYTGLVSRAGLKATMPGIEGFGDLGTRMAATEWSIEELDTAKRIISGRKASLTTRIAVLRGARPRPATA